MDLDDYKTVKLKNKESFSLKGLPELAAFMRGRTRSVVQAIKRSLLFEIIFAVCFFIFDAWMLILLKQMVYVRIFAFLLLIFCAGFIFYLIRLWRYIRFQYALDIAVNDQLAKYLYIISRFTRLYFQLTMLMIPLILSMAIVAAYLDADRSGGFVIAINTRTISIYMGLAIIWSLIMYFVTRWYIRKLYGNHLSKLKEQLRELEED